MGCFSSAIIAGSHMFDEIKGEVCVEESESQFVGPSWVEQTCVPSHVELLA